MEEPRKPRVNLPAELTQWAARVACFLSRTQAPVLPLYRAQVTWGGHRPRCRERRGRGEEGEGSARCRASPPALASPETRRAPPAGSAAPPLTLPAAPGRLPGAGSRHDARGGPGSASPGPRGGPGPGSLRGALPCPAAGPAGQWHGAAERAGDRRLPRPR